MFKLSLYDFLLTNKFFNQNIYKDILTIVKMVFNFKTIIIILTMISLLILTTCTPNETMKNETNKKDMSYYVTKESMTEPAFNNEYWDEKSPGIYTDINTGEALFSSLDKFDSGTGWPSFTKTINEALIETKEDASQGMIRTEIRTNESHLGHVFDDGPDGLPRFCVNSASLNFIPYEQLDSKGYGEYKKLFPYKEAVFAGGCFWGVEYLFEKLDGVVSAISGYSGGDLKDPNYKQVSTGNTGHAESVLVIYNPSIISYGELIDYFWKLHNPTELNRQGPDVGTQYRSAIFYKTEEERKIAEESKTAFDAKGIFNKPAVTQIVAFEKFYPAEEYHQDYSEKNPSYVCHELRTE